MYVHMNSYKILKLKCRLKAEDIVDQANGFVIIETDAVDSVVESFPAL